MDQRLKILGIVVFGVAGFWNLRLMHKARLSLTGDQLLSLQRASDPKIGTLFASVVPLLLAYMFVGVFPRHAVAIVLVCVILSLAASEATGAYHLRKARGAGMPDDYLRSYRKGHLVLSVGVVIAIAAFAYPVVVALHAS
jgi:hypothetical protein